MDAHAFILRAWTYVEKVYRDMVRHAGSCQKHLWMVAGLSLDDRYNLPMLIMWIEETFRHVMSADEHCDGWSDLERIQQEYSIGDIHKLSVFFYGYDGPESYETQETVQEVITRCHLPEGDPKMYAMIIKVLHDTT